VVDESLERLLRGVVVDGDDKDGPPKQDGNDEGHHRCCYAQEEEEEDVREGDGDRNKDDVVTEDTWDGVVVVDKDIARGGVDNDEEDNPEADGNDAVEEGDEDDAVEGDEEVDVEDGDNSKDIGVVVAEILRAVSFPCVFPELWIWKMVR